MKTSIITINEINQIAPVFANDHLNKATQRIRAIYADAAKYAETKNREIAKILADVAAKKSYEADGFASVAEYAHTTFGIAKNNAYALANAGKVYSDKNAHPELQKMSPSKLAEIAALPEPVVKEAISNGKITAATTQKELREFASEEKAKGAKSPRSTGPAMFSIRTMYPMIDVLPDMATPRTLETWEEIIIDYVSTVSPDLEVQIVKLPKPNDDLPGAKKPTIRKLYLTRTYAIVIEFYKEKIGVAKPELTDEEIEELAEQLIADGDIPSETPESSDEE